MEDQKPNQLSNPSNITKYYEIFVKPTKTTPPPQKTLAKCTWFLNLLRETGGKLNLDLEKIQDLQQQGKIPKNIKPEEVELSLNLFARGVQAGSLISAFEKLELDTGIQGSLERVSQHLLTLAYAEPKLNSSLYGANQEPEVEIIQKVSTTPTPPPPQQANQINFSFQDNTATMVFQTGVEKLKGIAFDKAQNQLNTFVTKALERSGNKVLQEIGKQGLKNFANSAFTKVAPRLATKIVSKLAATKLGASIGSVIPGLGTAVGAALGFAIDLGRKLISPILRGLRKLLESITGQRDLRKQLVYIGLTGLVVGIGIRSIPLILVSGALALGASALVVSGTAVASSFFDTVSAATAALFSISFMSIITPILIALVVLPISVALILFIINSGAFLVPPGGYGATNLPPGSPTADCPSGWPVREGNGRTYFITQGPETIWSHTGREAIDISRSGMTIDPRDVVISTHAGVVTQATEDSDGGLWVEIRGLCQGREFTSWHVHFSTISVGVGTTVRRGTVLGIMGMTGQASHFHDHYEFDDHFPRMVNIQDDFYIPVTVPRGCVGLDSCGYIYIR